MSKHRSSWVVHWVSGPRIEGIVYRVVCEQGELVVCSTRCWGYAFRGRWGGGRLFSSGTVGAPSAVSFPNAAPLTPAAAPRSGRVGLAGRAGT